MKTCLFCSISQAIITSSLLLNQVERDVIVPFLRQTDYHICIGIGRAISDCVIGVKTSKRKPFFISLMDQQAAHAQCRTQKMASHQRIIQILRLILAFCFLNLIFRHLKSLNELENYRVSNSNVVGQDRMQYKFRNEQYRNVS